VIMAISAMPLMLMCLAQTTSPSLTPSPGERYAERASAREPAADSRGSSQLDKESGRPGWSETPRFRPCSAPRSKSSASYRRHS
jgi:hypothetical protein